MEVNDLKCFPKKKLSMPKPVVRSTTVSSELRKCNSLFALNDAVNEELHCSKESLGPNK